MDFDCDWLIIGSGFGGSVSALRLTEKGYRVVMLEKGRRLAGEDFPKTNWNLKRWLWMPWLGWRGLFKMTFFRHVTVLSGVGVGGGSLVYANTLPLPRDEFFAASSWGGLADWKRELAPHYDTARRMLGVTVNPLRTLPDDILKQVGEDLGGREFQPATVGIYFGQPGVTVPDPYFGGEGPARTGCNACGGCLTGCRFNAKNSLDKNYLYFAEKRGLKLHADTEATWVRPLPEGGYEVEALEGVSLGTRQRRRFTARQVIFAGGVLGSVELLLKWMDKDGILPAEPTSALIISLFNEGKAGMVFSGPWLLGEISKDIDYGLAPLPKLDEAGGKPMRPWATVEGVYVSAKSANKDAAFELAQFLTSDASAKTLALEGRQSPANQAVYSDAKVSADPRLKAFREQVETAVPMPNIPEMSMVWSPATSAMGSILKKTATPKAALDAAQKSVVKDVANLRKK